MSPISRAPCVTGKLPPMRGTLMDYGPKYVTVWHGDGRDYYEHDTHDDDEF